MVSARLGEIKKVAADTPILIVSLDRTDAFVEVAPRIGVNGYLIKTDCSKTLLKAVDAVLRNETFFPIWWRENA
jgi:DNA-binding NarL/FixJ family response regulator